MSVHDKWWGLNLDAVSPPLRETARSVALVGPVSSHRQTVLTQHLCQDILTHVRKTAWKIRKRPRSSVVIEAIGKKARKGPQIQIWVGVEEDTSDPVEKARALRDSIAILDQHMEELVGECRANGYSWREIGEALGMSRQAAWERFSI